MSWQSQTEDKQQDLKELIALVHPTTLARLASEVYSDEQCLELVDRLVELVCDKEDEE
jgi:hypothetical protein